MRDYIRLTTDDPKNNMDQAFNLFFAKDDETWVRNGGPWPGCEDIKLTDFIRLAAKTMDLFSMGLPEDDRDLDALITDMMDEGPEEPEGLLAILHTAGWAFAELRERLKAWEDTGLTPEKVFSLKSERDAAVKALKEVGAAYGYTCEMCAHIRGTKDNPCYYSRDVDVNAEMCTSCNRCPCGHCDGVSQWEWRGLEKYDAAKSGGHGPGETEGGI